MMFAIITKGIDLSVGAAASQTAVVAASLAQNSSIPNAFFPGLVLPVFVPVVAGLITGALVGAVVGV